MRVSDPAPRGLGDRAIPLKHVPRPSHGWSVGLLLAEEGPDPAMQGYDPLDKDKRQRSDQAERETEYPQHDEVGRARTGRLVAPDQGFGDDVEADLGR
jgi:hypothetical protein